MKWIAYIFWAIVLIFSVCFSILNSSMVDFHYLFGTVNIYLPVLIFLMLFIGALLGIISMYPKHRRLKKALKKLRKKIQSEQNEDSKSDAE